MGPYVIWLAADGSESLTFADLPGGGGWARWFRGESESAPVVLVRIGPTSRTAGLDEALVVREVHTSAQPKVDAALLRRLPLGRLEAAVNRPAHHRRLSPVLHGRGPRVPIPADGLWSSEQYEMARETPARLDLDIPSGRARRPDSFYEKVAELYSWLATQSTHPAQQLADANKVPLTTAHGWVKEARARGILAPSQRRGRS